MFIGGSGFVLAAYITLGFLAARYAVHQFAAKPYWLAIGCMIGMLLGIVNIVVLILRISRRK